MTCALITTFIIAIVWLCSRAIEPLEDRIYRGASGESNTEEEK